MPSQQPGIAFDKEEYQTEDELTIDTGYCGDAETSFGGLSPLSKSDSEDNDSEIFFEGNNDIIVFVIRLDKSFRISLLLLLLLRI